MHYLITGGAGFIGSHIADELIKNHDVTVIDDLFSGKYENIKHLADIHNFSFIKGSVTDLFLLEKAFQDVDGIFHEAAITSVPRSIRNPGPTNEVNITGTLNVLIAARKCAVKKIVVASSSSVYGDTPTLPKSEAMILTPKSPYAITKLAGEHYCRVFSDLYGIKTVCLRYFNVFGPRQNPNSEYAAVIPKFITHILNHSPPTIYGDGTQTRDFTYVKDVVQGNIRAMESDCEGIFNIAYGNRISLNDLAESIMEICGIHQNILYENSRPGDVHDSLADISSAIKTIGYAPRYNVMSGLKETIEWFKTQ